MGLLALILLLLALHRPLILDGGRWLAIHFARKAGLSLDLRLGGTIYNQLTVSHLSATAIGPSAVRDLELGSLEVRYSIPDLLRHGMPELLKSVVLSDVKVVLDTPKPRPLRPPLPLRIPGRCKSRPGCPGSLSFTTLM